jgi:hypothetical protein
VKEKMLAICLGLLNGYIGLTTLLYPYINENRGIPINLGISQVMLYFGIKAIMQKRFTFIYRNTGKEFIILGPQAIPIGIVLSAGGLVMFIYYLIRYIELLKVVYS